MFGIGMTEMLVICGVALLIFGPTELPQIAKKIAKGMREIRRASDDLRRSIDIDDDDDRSRNRFVPEPSPAITGSALTAETDSGAPVLVPAAVVAVGSSDDTDDADDAAPTKEEPQPAAAEAGADGAPSAGEASVSETPGSAVSGAAGG